MLDVIRSSIIFSRAHRGATMLLVASLSLLFFVMLIQHALTFQGLREIEEYRSEYYTMYRVYFSSADQAATSSLLKKTYDQSAPVKYVNIYGEVVLANPSTIDSAPSVSNKSEELMDNSAQPRLTVFGMDSECTLPIDILRGSSPLENGGIMAEAIKFNLFGGSISSNSSGDHFITLANGVVKPITCFGSLRFWEQLPDLVVQREDFFSLTDSSVSIIAVFERPLSDEEEKEWLDNAAEIVTIEGVTRPNDYLGPVYFERDTGVLMSRILIVVCLLCTMRLMTYLFLLRKQEFIVLRMLGASTYKICTHILVMLLGVSGVAIVVGGIIYFGIISIPIATKILYPISLQWVTSDIVFFLISVLMTGICMFFLNDKVDVTRASEEV